MKKNRLSRREFLKRAGLTSVSLILTACGGKTAQHTPVDDALSDTGPSNEPTPVKFWFEAESHQPEYISRMEELNEKFNIEFTYELLASNVMAQKLPATLMAGNGFPDIVEQNTNNIVRFMKGNDSLIPYTDLKPALMAGPYAGQVLMHRFHRATKEGKLYGVPHDIHPVVMLYNDEAWQKYGIDLSLVDTYDKFLSACETVAQATNLQMPDGRPLGLIMDELSSGNLTARMIDKGIWWTDEAGNPMLSTAEMKAAAENWLMFHDYHIPLDSENQIVMIKEGQVMTQFCPDWMYNLHVQGTAEDKEWLINSPIRMARLPGMTADASRVTSWGGTSGAVPKQSPIAELSIEILLYLYFDNTDLQLSQRFLNTGILPPVSEAWDDEAFHKPADYLGGQIAGDILIEAALDLPKYYEQWTTDIVRAAWNQQFALAWAGEITLDACIAAAHEQAITEIEKDTYSLS